MGSEWAKEAVRRAEELTRELDAAGGGFGLSYQRREARFALKGRGETVYFPAHDYETRRGVDWAQLRKDVLARAASEQTSSGQTPSGGAPTGEVPPD